jgi:hypothetical protein
MHVARFQHVAVRLDDGRVLVAGGCCPVSASAEIYDPVSQTWSMAAPMSVARTTQSATILVDGRVLVAGGANISRLLETAEIYDPASNRWTPTKPMTSGRASHGAALLTDGRVLVYGGKRATVGPEGTLFDPTTGEWSDTSTADFNRDIPVVAVGILRDGRVAFASSYDEHRPVDVELYDPADGKWIRVGGGHDAHDQAAAVLPDGIVRIGGVAGFGRQSLGSDRTGVVQTLEAHSSIWHDQGTLTLTRSRALAVPLDERVLLVIGGESRRGPVEGSEIFQVGFQLDPVPGGGFKRE